MEETPEKEISLITSLQKAKNEVITHISAQMFFVWEWVRYKGLSAKIQMRIE